MDKANGNNGSSSRHTDLGEEARASGGGSGHGVGIPLLVQGVHGQGWRN